MLLPTLAPEAHALLKNPETRNVLEQTDGITVTDFISEIQSPGLLGENGELRLDAKQRPRAGTKISPPFLITCRNGCNGRTCVVGAAGNHLDRAEACLILEL